MKKVLSLILVLLVLSAFVVPFMALAEAVAIPSQNVQPTAELAPAEPATIMPVDEVQETDPGGVAGLVNLTDLIQAAFAVILGVITRFLVPWIKARTKAWQFDMLCQATSIAVNAAEQKLGSGAGKEKMNYVVSTLNKRGFTVNDDLIESLVKTLPENQNKASAT